ncbi:hypothetical protein [Streptomyces sp. WAC01280]|uniref:hypothetical protein n=1 Tax=Streptomyces sp. WAC01280 TaxID=2487424 RepID=UPI000F7A94D6|nr:hypothetical protein [Streptomyces sp. WAC01280]RSS57495.1 hypothetical protein EF909_16290 [Streptomyces sp. WAC01280]
MTRTPTKNRWRKLAFACAVSALAVGCTTNEPTSQKPPTTPPTSTPTTAPPKTEAPADPVETAKKEAIATYLSHWKEAEKRYADKAGKAGDLKKYAAAAALAQVETDSANLRKKNAVILGTVTVDNPAATSADINRKIPNVIILSCLDVSRWTVTDTDTQKPAALPKNRLLRYAIKATVEKWPEGWRVIRDEPQGKKC